jgi:hypothetical protein
MTEIGKKLIEIVRRKAGASPDFVYGQPNCGYCQYIRNGQPDCIIGHALVETGLIDASYEEQVDNGQTLPTIIGDLGVELGKVERVWLSFVQDAQDAKKSWGQAVAEADRHLASYQLWRGAANP